MALGLAFSLGSFTVCGDAVLRVGMNSERKWELRRQSYLIRFMDSLVLNKSTETILNELVLRKGLWLCNSAAPYVRAERK